MNPMLAGVIIGLLLGIALALGVAIWLNRTSSAAFVEKTKPVDALPTIKPPTPATTASERPRFEFYDLLPGDKGGPAKADPASPPKIDEKAARPAAPVTAAALPPQVAASQQESFYLQAGAFQNEADADNLKAKIAFAGFESSVKPVNVADKGTLFRVRLGPIKGGDEVNRIKLLLSQNGIQASAVKAE